MWTDSRKTQLNDGLTPGGRYSLLRDGIARVLKTRYIDTDKGREIGVGKWMDVFYRLSKDDSVRVHANSLYAGMVTRNILIRALVMCQRLDKDRMELACIEMETD